MFKKGQKPPVKGRGPAIDWLHKHVNHTDPKCLTWPFYRNPNGYGHVQFNGKSNYAHRAMCELAHGAPPTPKHEAAHKCGSGHQGCVNPKHLAWKTKAENRQESTTHGRGGRHSYGIRGKLSDAQVEEIRASKGLVRNTELAAKFGVSWTTINSIQNGHHRSRPSKVNFWKPEEDEKLAKLLDEGLRHEEIAAIIGRPMHAVSGHAHRLGLKSRRGSGGILLPRSSI